MLNDLTDASRRLLSIIQKSFPLDTRPFASLASGTGLEEGEALKIVRELKERGLIVEISGIFNAAALGYNTTLVAMKVPPQELDKAAQIISLHRGVGHNYSRESLYNLWFTLSLHRDRDLKEEVGRMQKQAGAISSLILPSLRLFKIGVFIDPGKHGEEARIVGLDDEENGRQGAENGFSTDGHISPDEINIVRGLQQDLILRPEPFTELAESYGMEGTSFLMKARSLLEKRIMRRYAAQLPHRRLGFTFNAMVCWRVPPGRVEETGKALAASPWVTHCYERPANEDWPYNLYSMVHGKSREECLKKARSLSAQVNIKDYAPLFSPKEYKKARVRYFLGDQV